MFNISFKAASLLLSFTLIAEAQVCYSTRHDSQPDSSLKVCNVFSDYHPHLSCCPKDSTCLDNGLCFTPSNNSLAILQYAGCTWYWGAAPACPGAEYCKLKNVTGDQYPVGSRWNIIPCPSGKYCCSVDEVSNECCVNEEDTFEVSWGPVRDQTTSIYSTWTYTTTSYETTTETVCPTTSASLTSITPATTLVNPTLEARFTA